MEDCGLLPSGKKITPRQATFRNFTLKSTFNHQFDAVHKEGQIAFQSENMEPYLKEVFKNFLLELSVSEAAHGVMRVAVAALARAVKAVTTYRGRQPSAFAMVAFGGNGPLFAAELARELGIERVIVPELNPGLYRREIERIAGSRDVVGLERIDGELITADQIMEVIG